MTMSAGGRWVSRFTVVLAGLICAAVLALAGPAGGKVFRVYSCMTPDDRALGPTIDAYVALPSGWTASYSGYLNYSLNDHCPASGPFEFRGDGAMTAGQSVWARWTAPLGADLVRASMRWIGEALARPYADEGTVALTVATDQETLISRSSPVSIAFDSAAPNFTSALRPARWFEIRFTCADACASSQQPAIRGWVS